MNFSLCFTLVIEDNVSIQDIYEWIHKKKTFRIE